MCKIKQLTVLSYHLIDPWSCQGIFQNRKPVIRKKEKINGPQIYTSFFKDRYHDAITHVIKNQLMVYGNSWVLITWFRGNGIWAHIPQFKPQNTVGVSTFFGMFVEILRYLSVFLIQQLFHSRLLDIFDSYNQSEAPCLVGYLPSHIQCTLVE